MSEFPPKTETREGQEDVEKKFANIIFWSFQMSQGMPELQFYIFDAVLLRYPELRKQAALHLAKLAPNQDVSWHRAEQYEQDPYFTKTVDRAMSYISTAKHLDGAGNAAMGEERLRTSVKSAVFDQYRSFLGRAAGIEHMSESERETYDKAVQAFVEELINREDELFSDEKKENDPRMQQRRKEGFSYFMRYALADSADRAQTHLPPELRQLWQDAAAWIRNKDNVSKLSDSTIDALRDLKDFYEQTTNETVNLDLPGGAGEQEDIKDQFKNL
ncbi:MAG TPA: hypothetical protein VEB18_03950 [Candidatus Paceibacterota bacterium]|nr:hypothetical protein [Candidatus Paceibacterota bacterium]